MAYLQRDCDSKAFVDVTGFFFQFFTRGNVLSAEVLTNEVESWTKRRHSISSHLQTDPSHGGGVVGKENFQEVGG